MSRTPKRSYVSKVRDEAAAQTRANVLKAAKALFTRRGIDAVTMAELAAKAGVSTSTVYGLFQSKEGVLRALMETALFGGRYQVARARLEEIADPVEQVRVTASVARAIYESESAELGLMRGASAFSPALRKIEQKFEHTRFTLQRERIERLHEGRKLKKGLTVDGARRILWMYTSRDVYRLLVDEGGWPPDEYERWLAQTLVDALVER